MRNRGVGQAFVDLNLWVLPAAILLQLYGIASLLDVPAGPQSRTSLAGTLAVLALLSAPLPFLRLKSRLLYLLILDVVVTLTLGADSLFFRVSGNMTSLSELSMDWRTIRAGLSPSAVLGSVWLYPILVGLGAWRLARNSKDPAYGRAALRWAPAIVLVAIAAGLGASSVPLVRQDPELIFRDSTTRRQAAVALGVIPYHILDAFVAQFDRHLFQPRPDLFRLSAGRRNLLVIAHRGNPSDAPEDTLASIRSGLSLGADLVEVDVHLTKDGIPVIIHDETVDKTTNGSGSVDQMTLAELKALDAGAWKDKNYSGERIPTLEEALRTAMQAGGHLLLDVPVANMGVHLAKAFQAVGLPISEAILGTWDEPQRVDFARHMAGATTFLSESIPQRWDGGFIAMSRAMGICAFEIPNPTPEFIAASHAQGMPVFVYTINDEAAIRAWIAAGVDGIETDEPALAIRLANKLGVRPRRAADISKAPL